MVLHWKTTNTRGGTRLIELVAACTIAATVLHTTSAQTVSEEPDASMPEKKPQVTISTEWTSEETTDWGYDRKSSRSRIGMSGSVKLPGKTKSLKSTSSISQLIDIKPPKQKTFCESDIDVDYYQRSHETEIRTLFTSQNCEQFDAVYQLRISYFDENRQLKRIKSVETWPSGRIERLSKTFQMEPNSELRRVTSHIVSCTCKETQ